MSSLIKLKLSFLMGMSLIFFEGSAQFRVGITGGGAVSSVVLSSKVQVDQAQASHADIQKPVNTLYGGVVFQFKAGKKLMVRPEITYFKKAWEVTANDRARLSALRFLRKYSINYIQVPVNVLLTSSLASGRIYVGLGPYIAFAINGVMKEDGNIIDLEFKKFDEPIFTYLPSDNYKPVQFVNHYTINRFDYGVNGIMGYEFAFGLFLEVGVNIGSRQISTSYERFDLLWNRTIRDPASSVRYSIVKLGIGWMINYKARSSK